MLVCALIGLESDCPASGEAKEGEVRETTARAERAIALTVFMVV